MLATWQLSLLEITKGIGFEYYYQVKTLGARATKTPLPPGSYAYEIMLLYIALTSSLGSWHMWKKAGDLAPLSVTL